MILKIGEGEAQKQWHIHIHHEFLPDDSQLPRKKRRSWDVVTKALVHTGPCVAASGPQKYCVTGRPGEVRCSKKDNFVKCVGAKQALKQALSGLDKATREALWKAYWLLVKRPKERPEHFRRRVAPVTQKASLEASNAATPTPAQTDLSTQSTTTYSPAHQALAHSPHV